MIAMLLLIAGLLLLVGTAVAARMTRRPEETSPSGEGVHVFAPRSVSEVERDRLRWWPAVAALLAVILIAAGLAWVQTGPVTERAVSPAPEPSPYLIRVHIAGGPDASPTPSPSPTASPEPTTADEEGSNPTSGSRGGRSESDEPRAEPTPTPTPKPGPSIGANASCFDGAAQLGYTLTARQGTTLDSASISLDGGVVQSPSVSGRSQYSGNYQTSVSSGSHTFTIRATGSDGGVTSRTYPFRC